MLFLALEASSIQEESDLGGTQIIAGQTLLIPYTKSLLGTDP